MVDTFRQDDAGRLRVKHVSMLPTLTAALSWFDGLTDELADIPLRLHDHAVGDKDALGAPRFSGAFWHLLVGSAFASHSVKSIVSCYHPLLMVGAPCPECFGSDVKDATRDVYDRPLSASIVKLSQRPPDGKAATVQPA